MTPILENILNNEDLPILGDIFGDRTAPKNDTEPTTESGVKMTPILENILNNEDLPILGDILGDQTTPKNEAECTTESGVKRTPIIGEKMAGISIVCVNCEVGKAGAILCCDPTPK